MELIQKLPNALTFTLLVLEIEAACSVVRLRARQNLPAPSISDAQGLNNLICVLEEFFEASSFLADLVQMQFSL